MKAPSFPPAKALGEREDAHPFHFPALMRCCFPFRACVEAGVSNYTFRPSMIAERGSFFDRRETMSSLIM